MNRSTDKADTRQGLTLHRREVLRFAAGVTLTAATGAIMPITSTASAASSKEIWGWDAAEIAEAINRGQISSVEATRSCLGRIAAVNPEINAVVNVLADEAISAAEERDRAKRDGGPLGPCTACPSPSKSMSI